MRVGEEVEEEVKVGEDESLGHQSAGKSRGPEAENRMWFREVENDLHHLLGFMGSSEYLQVIVFSYVCRFMVMSHVACHRSLVVDL